MSVQGNYSSCSDVVGKHMSADVMQSVEHLVPDILNNIPVLLYQVSCCNLPVHTYRLHFHMHVVFCIPLINYLGLLS